MSSFSDIQIFWTRIGEIHPAHYAHSLALLTPEQRARLGRFRNTDDAYRSLYGKMLLREGLKRTDNIMLDFGELAYTTHRKPLLTDGRMHFNIAHAGAFTVCALCATSPVGLDIEEITPIPADDFRTHLTPEEWEYIARSADATGCFFDLWTRKEAVTKADGRGLNIPLQSFSVLQNPVTLDDTTWFVQEVPLAADYRCHLATTGEQPRTIQLTYIKF